MNFSMSTAGVERIAQYILRCPFSLQRLIRVTDQGQVNDGAEIPPRDTIPDTQAAVAGPNRL
jgi:hypothetical protein